MENLLWVWPPTFTRMRSSSLGAAVMEFVSHLRTTYPPPPQHLRRGSGKCKQLTHHLRTQSEVTGSTSSGRSVSVPSAFLQLAVPSFSCQDPCRRLLKIRSILTYYAWESGSPAVSDIAIRHAKHTMTCLLYTSPSPRDGLLSRMPSSA